MVCLCVSGVDDDDDDDDVMIDEAAEADNSDTHSTDLISTNLFTLQHCYEWPSTWTTWGPIFNTR